MEATGQDDILGSADLSRENDKIKEKYEALKLRNFKDEKELVELHMKEELTNSTRRGRLIQSSIHFGYSDKDVEGFFF